MGRVWGPWASGGVHRPSALLQGSRGGQGAFSIPENHRGDSGVIRMLGPCSVFWKQRLDVGTGTCDCPQTPRGPQAPSAQTPATDRGPSRVSGKERSRGHRQGSRRAGGLGGQGVQEGRGSRRAESQQDGCSRYRGLHPSSPCTAP